jgi:hypothetical protein
MRKNLKLYVWEDVLCDWTCGIAFALASSEAEARRLINVELGNRNSEGVIEDGTSDWGRPKVYTTRVAYAIYGGG